MGRMIPKVLGLLFCDAVYRDTKWCLLGLFNGLVAPDYPTTIPKLHIFFVLSGISGTATIRLALCRADEDDLGSDITVAGAEMTVEADDRMSIVEGPISIENLVLDMPSSYTLRLFYGDEEIGSRSFDAVQREAGP